MPERPFLSPEGTFSLRLPEGWQWEQDSEDGHFILLRPDLSSTVLLTESLWSQHAGDRTIDDLLCELPGTGRGALARCALNGLPAACVERVQEDPSGRRRRVRQWVATDQRTILYVTHEVDEAVGAAEDGAVDDLLATLEMHSAPHPVIATLLERLNHDGKRWEWRPSDPMEIRCPALGHTLSTETLVRTVDVHPERWNAALEDLVRKIRNLEVFAGAGPPAFERVGTGLLPLIRGETVLEAANRFSVVSASNAIDGRRLLRRRWADGLYVYYALDVPGAFGFITPSIAEAWGVGMDRIESEAVANLAARIRRDRLQLAGPDPYRFLVLEDGEGLAASRLLVPRFRQALEEGMGPEFMVALPSAGVLIAFSVGFEGWKEYLGEDIWEAYTAEPIPITSTLYRVTPELR